MNFIWKIESVKATDDLITQAKYHVRAEKKENWVATEGTWFFKDAKRKVPYAEVTEEMVIDWIKSEDEGAIENCLTKQMTNLTQQSKSSLPWAPQIFKPKI